MNFHVALLNFFALSGSASALNFEKSAIRGALTKAGQEGDLNASPAELEAGQEGESDFTFFKKGICLSSKRRYYPRIQFGMTEGLEMCEDMCAGIANDGLVGLTYSISEDFPACDCLFEDGTRPDCPDDATCPDGMHRTGTGPIKKASSQGANWKYKCYKYTPSSADE